MSSAGRFTMWRATLMLSVALAATTAPAATRTWSGAAIGNNQWINITNWGFTPPANGDSLVFPSSAGNKSSLNNLGVTNYGTIFFAGSNYVFSGGTIGLSGGIVATNTSGTNTFVTPLLLRTSQSFSNSNFASVLQIAGSLNLNGNDLTFSGGGDVRAVSAIIGSGDIVKAGFGDLFLQAASSFSGTTYLALANLYLRHPLALGDTNFPIVVTNLTRRVFLGTNIFVTNKSLLLGIQSELWGEGGTNGWMGPIALTSTDPFLRLDNGGRLHLGGPISGAGDWHVVGPGTVVLESPQTNTASGTWDLSVGVTMLLDQAPGLPSGHRYFVAEGSTVRLLASDQLSDTRSLILSDGTLDLNGFSDRIAFHTDSSTNGSGRILFGSSGTNALTFGSTSATSIFSGTLSGAGDLVKIGGSTHILRGTNNSTGDTIINGSGGVLAVDGRIAGLTIVTNGMLTGTGRMAAVTINGANGMMDPGLGTNSTARLTISAASSWLAGRVQLQLNGLTPATQHDQIQVDAAPAITNCALQVSLGFAPALGSSFVIVTNTSAGAINGHFAGLPEGAVLNAGGTLLRISYLGGNGNDITLTVVSSVTTGITRTWSGGGGNSFWRTGADWVGGTPPSGGDRLYFPPGALRTINTNDFPPLFVDSILFGATGYDVRGAGVTLLSGLTATNPSGLVLVRTPLTLGTNQAITQTTPLGTLNLPAPIDVGPHQLIINATGSVITSGSILGSGSLIKRGPGQCVVLGTNALAGTNFIEEGIYFVDGAIPNAQVRIGPNATLNGIGYLGRVQCFGTIAPAETGGQGALTFGDDVRFATGSVARFKFESVAPGGFDQMVMTNAGGLFAISNATLVIEANTPLNVGDAFTIIDKAGSGLVTGTFNGLPEGATFTISNSVCAITYRGGTSNDVVVTVIGIAPTGLTRTWTGTGTNDLWTTAANWGGGLPQPGDSLEFPVVAARKANTNNFPAGTTFNQLQLAGGYRLLGSNVTLLGGALAENGGSTIDLSLTLALDQTFTADANDTLAVRDINLGARTLTLDSQGASFLSVNGVVTGSGNIIKTGSGVWSLDGTNHSAGTNFINAGELRAHGAITAGRVIAAAGTEVNGLGYIHRLQSFGRVKPGEDTEGALNVGTELHLTNGSVLAFEWPAAPPPGGFNKVVVTNDAATAIISNATLEAQFTAPPVVGQSYTILDKAGATPVLGTFAGLSEGSLFSLGNIVCRITYTGGTGNDVVLTVISTGPTGLERVWTGAAFPNTNWSNPLNWSGNTLPASGDDLMFPGPAQGKLNFNDLPPTTIFNSLRFATGTTSYFLFSANPIPLLNGILTSNLTFSVAVPASIRLLADQAFRTYEGALFLGNVLLDGHELTLDSTNSFFFGGINAFSTNVHARITGDGSLRKRGSGVVEFRQTNSYTGLTIVEEGEITVAQSGTLGSTAGGTVVSNGARLRLFALAGTIAEPVTLAGTLNQAAAVTSVWSGPITVTSTNAAFEVVTNGVLRVANPISSSLGLIKSGPGTLALDADQTYAGATRVQAGTLAFTNAHLPGVVTLNTGATLAASGDIGGLSSTGGTVAAGTLAAPGLLQVNGAFTLDAASRFDVDIDGTGAGTTYDQVRVTGGVTLGGAQLALGISVSAPVGSTFVIIRKDSGGAVNGTFAGLPQNATFTRGAFVWQIDYFGVDGNDVVLRVISQTFPGVVWDGGGADTNWLTAQNWLNDATPASGSDLIFSNEADRRTNFNNFAAGTLFNSVRLTGLTNVGGTGFNLNGNALALAGGILADTNAAASTINVDLGLAGGPISADAPASLRFNGAISNSGPALELRGSGTLNFFGPITSAAGLASSVGFVQLRTNNFLAASSLISTGTVRVDADGVFGAPSNTVTIESVARMQLQNATNLANPVVLRGSLSAFRTNALSGAITVEATNATLGAPGTGPLRINGAISGSADLTLLGGSAAAPLVFNGSNTHNGIMRLASGLLLVNGSGTGGELHLATNQTFFPTVLAGTGTVSAVRAGGTISPGVATNVGILTVAGDLVLSNSAVFEIQVNGLGAGAGHDQLRVAGNVHIEDASLQLTQPPSFLPTVGDSLVILRNDGPNPVNGIFAGLPQGGFLTNIAVFQISYTGGDGNDIALVVTAQKGLFSLWTGNGATTNWTEGANWLSTLPPDPGDTLIFSNGIPNRIAHNNYPAGTTFGRLIFLGFTSGQPFFLSGGSLTLTHGIDGFFLGSNVISMPITLGAPQTFSNRFGLLAFRGGINNGGHDLALAGVGTFDFLAPFSGAGGLNWTNDSFGSFGFLRLRTNNPYTGPTAFDGNIAVQVSDPGGLGAPSSGTYIGRNVQCLLQTPMTLNEPVTLVGRLDFASGSNAMSAPLTLQGSNLLMCISGPRMEFNGPINGGGFFQACGISTNFYNAGGLFDGTVEIFAGQHTFIGDYPNMDLRAGGTVNFSSTIAGTGRVRSIVASDAGTNSIIAPGANGPGVLTLGGRFIIESNITLRVELNGTTPGSGHDQIVTDGPVALTNATLELSLGFTPGASDSFIILRNDGGAPIAGAFDGLPEGSLLTNGATVLQISYVGGNGNDIVLRPPGLAPATITTIVCLPDGTKQFEILGPPNAAYVIEAATNLLSPPNLIPWLPISTNTANALGVLQFLDLNSTNFLQRFYRAVSP